MEKYNGSIRLGVNVDVSKLDKTEAQLKRIIDLLERINKPRHINVVDGEGSLRCVLGPLDVEIDSVFIKDATIQNAIISANNFQVAGGPELNGAVSNKGGVTCNVESILQNALANNKHAAENNACIHYDELNKKLDYIISLMPSPRF